MILAMGLPAGLLDRDLGVEDGARLDLHEVGDHEAQAAAAQAQHRVLLVHRLDGREQLAVLGARGVAGLGDLDELLLEVGQELVERRVDEPDDDGQAVHRPEDALEVALLEHLELGHRGVEARDDCASSSASSVSPAAAFALARVAAPATRIGAAHDLEPLALAEHVLGAAEADALGAVAARLRGLLGLVGVGPDAQAADRRRPSRGSAGGRAGPRSGPRRSGARPRRPRRSCRRG